MALSNQFPCIGNILYKRYNRYKATQQIPNQGTLMIVPSQQSRPLDHILSQINRDLILVPCFFKMFFDIGHIPALPPRSPKWPLPFVFAD
jgi:hypothetical protein